MATIKVADIRIHPIKSCRGISRESWKVTKIGLQYDRIYMFVDTNDRYLTIRDRAEMTLIRTDITTDGEPMLHIEFPHVEKSEGDEPPKTDYSRSKKLHVPLEPSAEWLAANAELIPVNIWDTENDGYKITTPDVASAVADYFGTPDVKLVFKGPMPRICVEEGDPHWKGKVEHVQYQDFLPILVANQHSIRDLNHRLTQAGAQEITIERFRPNIILDGDLEPWGEDAWKSMLINPPKTTLGYLSTLTGIGNEAVDLEVGLPCLRCLVPNVDPDSAKKDKKQPWTELMSFRRIVPEMKYKPVFGMLSFAKTEGTISVGMEVQITQK